MPLYEIYAGRVADSQLDSLEHTEVAAYLRSRRARAIGGLITGTAALSPWIALAPNRLFHLTPVGHAHTVPLPLWGFAVLGLADGVRAGSLAISYWVDRLLPTGELTNDEDVSLRSWLRTRKISVGQAIAWLVLALLLLFILRGVGRRLIA
jgi:hypothetical protein